MKRFVASALRRLAAWLDPDREFVINTHMNTVEVHIDSDTILKALRDDGLGLG